MTVNHEAGSPTAAPRSAPASSVPERVEEQTGAGTTEAAQEGPRPGARVAAAAAAAQGDQGVRDLLSRADPATRHRLALGMQASIGNAAVQRLLAGTPARPALGSHRLRLPGPATRPHAYVQRDAGEVDESAAMVKAVQLVNRNSLAKVKLPIKAPAGLKVFGALELKKLELELDIRGDLKSPQVSSTSSGTTVRGGRQGVSTSETAAADGRKTDAKAAVYALELEQKFGSSPFEEMFSWKAGVEHGRYTPTNALTPSKRDFKGKFGFKLAAEGFELEVSFAPIAYDAAKKGADAWSIASTTVQIAKVFKTELPRALNVGGAVVNATLDVKVTGSAEFGPDHAATTRVLGKLLPKESVLAFLQASAPAIAKEEADKFTTRLIKEMIEARTADISDPGIKALVRREATLRLAEDVAARELQLQLAEQCSIFIRREMVEKAQSELWLGAIGNSADNIVRKTAQEFLTGAPQAAMLRTTLGIALKQTIKEVSLKSVARKAATALIPGPADFVLIAPEIIFGYIDTVVKDQEIKTLGLRTLAARDNYVAGYTAGLRGAGGGGGPAGGGAGNFEGAAHMMGLSDGAKMFDKAVGLQGTEFSPDELRPHVAEQMVGLPVDRTQIIAVAAPKLKKMMMDAFEKKYSGGLLRFLFGQDFKDSKDYKNFEAMIDSHMKEGVENTTVANLSNGVKVPLVMLDSTSDRARYFRTLDGRYSNVTISGDTENYSGWVTEDGTPLEHIYTSQETADETKSKEANEKRMEEHRAALASGRLHVTGKYNVISFRITSASLSGVPSDLEFKEFMRSPEFQGSTVAGAGLTASVAGTCTWTHEFYDQLDEDITVDFTGTVRPGSASVVVNHDSDHPELTKGDWASSLASTLLADVGGTRFAQLPHLG